MHVKRYLKQHFKSKVGVSVEKKLSKLNKKLAKLEKAGFNAIAKYGVNSHTAKRLRGEIHHVNVEIRKLINS